MQAMVDRWNDGDVEGFVEELGPSFEFTPDPSFPDADTYSGEDWQQWMLDWARTWGESRLEMLGVSERSNNVLVDARWHLRAKTGGEVPAGDFSFVVWFDPGPEIRAVRSAAFFDRERAEAVAAADTG
jgi:hypothetical protein